MSVEFFCQMNALIEEFCSQRHLKVMPTNAGWDLVFRHPSGGYGKISLLNHVPIGIKFWLGWWYDDYEAAVRHVKEKEGPEIVPEKQQLEDALDCALREIASWSFGEWDMVRGGFAGVWHARSKEEFEALNLGDHRFPLPKPPKV